MTGEDVEVLEEESLEERTLRVRYKGTSNYRILSRRDLSGDPADSADDVISWTPGSNVDVEFLLEYARTPERLQKILLDNAHDFEILGPGAEDFMAEEAGELEFDIAGPDSGE